MRKIIQFLKKLSFTQILLIVNIFIMSLVLVELAFHPIDNFFNSDSNISSPTKSVQKSSPGSYSSPYKNEESTQCLGITKKGKQCKNWTKNPSGYCYHHDGN